MANEGKLKPVKVIIVAVQPKLPFIVFLNLNLKFIVKRAYVHTLGRKSRTRYQQK